MSEVRILMVGDVVGKPGRVVLQEKLAGIVATEKVHLVVANVENAAGGTGITPDLVEKLRAAGVQVMTNGDHAWNRREVYPLYDSDPTLLRPVNYPEGVPGRGAGVYETDAGPVGVVNVIGRVFMGHHVGCPYRAAERHVAELKRKTRVVVVDFHAEATSEKIGMGWHLDGRATAVVGTHTHVQTADERILPGGTAHISDLGMTGPHDSILGRDKHAVLKKFLTQMPHKFEVAEGDARIHGALVTADASTGKATDIRRIRVGLDGTGDAAA